MIKELKFPTISTDDCKVIKEYQHKVILHKEYLEYIGEYDALYIEDGEGIERVHYWDDVFLRSSLLGVKIYFNYDSGFWIIKLLKMVDQDSVFMFNDEALCKEIFDVLKKYVTG